MLLDSSNKCRCEESIVPFLWEYTDIPYCVPCNVLGKISPIHRVNRRLWITTTILFVQIHGGYCSILKIFNSSIRSSNTGGDGYIYIYIYIYYVRLKANGYNNNTWVAHRVIIIVISVRVRRLYTPRYLPMHHNRPDILSQNSTHDLQSNR